MRKLDKRILDDQIRVFYEWGRRMNNASQGGHTEDVHYLEMFATFTHRTDILDVEDQDVQEFLDSQIEGLTYPHQRDKALKSINKMRRFYSARTKQGNKRMVPGRPPHIGEIAQAQEYRKMRDSHGKPLSLKEISRLMGNKSLSLIHRWVKYPLKDRLE